MRFFRPSWLPFFCAAGWMWLMALLQWSGDWEVYPQYNFGWLVVPLAFYLAWRRWNNRPDPRPCSCSGRAAAALFALGLLCWLFLWLLREANPDWRLVTWGMAGCVICATFFVLGLIGGRPWMRHFAFPVLLILIAIPLPTALEQLIVQSLTRLVTAFTVEALVWCGSYAVQSGNVILLANGALGVDEACSGVRSFQSNLMAALVVGELYRFRLPHRALLLAAALLAGFALNLVRAFFLASIAARGQLQQVNVWHDPAGYTILLVSFVFLLGLAHGMRRRSGPQPELPIASSVLPPPPAWSPCAWSALAALIMVPVLSEVWYRAHESPATPLVSWTIDWQDVPGVRPRSIPPNVRSILRYSEARSTVWDHAPAGPWYFYEISWEPGRTAAQMARSHTPDICLPAAGAVLLEQGQSFLLQKGAVQLPITPYVFLLGSQKVFVFFSIWEQHPADQADSSASAYDPAQRLHAVRQGRRNRGQKVLHATLTGFDDLTRAREAYLQFLQNHLRENPPPRDNHIIPVLP